MVIEIKFIQQRKYLFDRQNTKRLGRKHCFCLFIYLF
jgi:hypothetical protein